MKHARRKPRIPRRRGKLLGPALAPAATHARARNFVDAARLLMSADPLGVAFYPSVHVLVGQGIEQSLKAFLSVTGVPEAVLRDPGRIGHDLMRALAMARKRRLDRHVKIGPTARRLVKWLNELHLETRFYSQTIAGATGLETPPPASKVLAIAERLNSGIRSVCYPPRKKKP